MEYLIIIAFQMLGVGFHVGQKIAGLRVKYPQLGAKEIFNDFFKEDWNTLFVSGLILFTHLLVHYVVDEYTPEFRTRINLYILYAFGTAFMLGYLGQRMVYKWLGTAEKFIDKKVENKLQ